jgi:hypothetical protein
MEKGLVRPTVAQAIAIEKLSGGRIDAALLNVDVAASRSSVIDNQSAAGSWAEAIANSPNLRVEDYSADRVPTRVIICDVCEQRVDGEIPNACTFVDCPHASRSANLGIAA